MRPDDLSAGYLLVVNSHRSELDLFANVIWCKSVPNVPNRHGDIDICIIRENTEGEYSQLEYEVGEVELVGGGKREDVGKWGRL